MIIGLVSDFLPECKSKRIFGLFIHQAGMFGVKFLSKREVCGKMLLNRIALIDCSENSWI